MTQTELQNEDFLFFFLFSLHFSQEMKLGFFFVSYDVQNGF